MAGVKQSRFNEKPIGKEGEKGLKKKKKKRVKLYYIHTLQSADQFGNYNKSRAI